MVGQQPRIATLIDFVLKVLQAAGALFATVREEQLLGQASGLVHNAGRYVSLHWQEIWNDFPSEDARDSYFWKHKHAEAFKRTQDEDPLLETVQE